MLRFALCDDNREDLLRQERDVRAFLSDHFPETEVSLSLFSEADALLSAMRRGNRFDILFLDVLMPLLSGIEAAREIRQTDKAVKIIFLTSSADFALESYDVKAYSYLLKDAPVEKLRSVLEDALREIGQEQGTHLLVKTKTGLARVFFSSVIFVEVMGKTITFNLTGGEKAQMYGTLSEMEAAFLSQDRFIKPHRSFIANMDHVRRLAENEMIMLDASRVPVAKANYADVKQRYVAYSFTRKVFHG